jgi:epoxyqueuosine reductase
MKDLLHLNSDYLSELGIVDWGYTENSLPTSFHHYENWLQNNYHAPLSYLSDERKDKRSDLKNVYPDFQSALVFLFSYRPAKKWMMENNRHEVAAYTLGFEGEDYHYALKTKLKLISEKLSEKYPEMQKFISLDTQPILERDLAHRAGLGWFGKNSMLINKREGSYFIIGSLLLSRPLPLVANLLDVDHCGQCVACIESCPTHAIDPVTRTLIADRCISTFTIEVFKEVAPPQGMEKSRGEIFGCDICQDVCPWNNKPLLKTIASLKLKEQFSFLKVWLFDISKEKLLEIISKETNRSFKRRLSGTPFDRPGKIGWLKNLKAYFHPK